MSYKIGQGYLGSGSLQVSTANQELVPNPPSNWTVKYNLYKFSFDNTNPCSIRINGGSPIHLRGGQGFEVTHVDAPIWSFVIVEAGIEYNWIGAW
ncbi:hypothetical protein P4V41_07075 [Fictibacillus nanhaiensis]|uniref:hypothetical protein n=1 Tax=Fictibacillus nanhaiensis TaxID=742169 RepID=UPI002E22833C|nr:hypothetical protein [Fictibacillus nanhaiensis]